MFSVPSIALDLLETEKFRKTRSTLEAISYGGAPAPAVIPLGITKLPGGEVNK